MAIPKEKKKSVLDWGIDDDVLEDLEKFNQLQAEAAAEAGIESKEKSEVDEEETEDKVDASTKEEEEKEEPESETEDKEENPLTREEVLGALKMIADNVEKLAEATDERFEALEKKVDESERSAEDEINKVIQDTPPASLVGMLAKSMSAVGSEETKVDGRTTLAQSKPKETEADDEGPYPAPFLNKMISQKEEVE